MTPLVAISMGGTPYVRVRSAAIFSFKSFPDVRGELFSLRVVRLYRYPVIVQVPRHATVVDAITPLTTPVHPVVQEQVLGFSFVVNCISTFVSFFAHRLSANSPLDVLRGPNDLDNAGFVPGIMERRSILLKVVLLPSITVDSVGAESGGSIEVGDAWYYFDIDLIPVSFVLGTTVLVSEEGSTRPLSILDSHRGPEFSVFELFFCQDSARVVLCHNFISSQSTCNNFEHYTSY